MIEPSLMDPTVSQYPPIPLPDDAELRKVNVMVRYATVDEVQPHQMASPYGGLMFQIGGDLVTVANWIDENLEAGAFALASSDLYVQGAMLNSIKRSLLKGGVREFGSIAYYVMRAVG